jgi:cobalt-zinc-cadmium efflux system membrane fusion protein
MIRIFYDFRVTALILLGTLCAAVLLVSSNAIAAEEEHEEEVVHISTSLAQELGIETELAGAGVINRDLLLYGRTMPDPQGISHLSARYPGMIVSMVPSLGDSVEVGEVIAVIEANTSLQTYEIKAPLSGIVVEKHANPGELASGQPLLTIANYDNIWVDLAVFPGDSHQVRTGMSVTIRMDDRVAESAIRYINPSQGESPTVIARVEGLVHVESENVAIAVKNDALHLFEDNQVVFVLEDETYEPRIVTVGSSDPFLTEILSGLKPGERYVVANSYLIKADLEKEGVEHGH